MYASYAVMGDWLVSLSLPLLLTYQIQLARKTFTPFFYYDDITIKFVQAGSTCISIGASLQ